MFNSAYDYTTHDAVNQEQKSGMYGKHLDMFAKLKIGTMAIMIQERTLPILTSEKNISELARTFGISRQCIYESCIPFAKKVIDDAEKAGSLPDKKEFYERTVISLALDCCSTLEGIQNYLRNAHNVHYSIGHISAILTRASEIAKRIDDDICLSGIRQGANDEIYQNGTPVFTGIDPISTYVYLVRSMPDATAESWKNALDALKTNGLCLDVSISDGGTGLMCGIPKAFSDVQIQSDVFHVLRDLGQPISRITRYAESLLRELCQIEEKINSGRVQLRTLEHYFELEPKAIAAIEKADTMNLLYGWFREAAAYSGYTEQEANELCIWILSELEGMPRNSYEMQKAIRSVRERIPNVLVFINRIFECFEAESRRMLLPAEAFRIAYSRKHMQAGSQEYIAAGVKLTGMLGGRVQEVESAVAGILTTVKRASSMVENLNGRLRKYMDLKRGLTDNFLVLLKVYINTTPYRRSRISDRVAKSPLERLTGKSHPCFLDLLAEYGMWDDVA